MSTEYRLAGWKRGRLTIEQAWEQEAPDKSGRRKQRADELAGRGAAMHDEDDTGGLLRYMQHDLLLLYVPFGAKSQRPTVAEMADRWRHQLVEVAPGGR